MAKRNRKNKSTGYRTAFWGITLCVLVAALSVVYLSLHNNCERMGQQINDLERQRQQLEKQVKTEEDNWAIACSTRNMVRLLAVHGIAMSWPEERNIIRLRPVEIEEPARYARGSFSM